MNAQAEELNSLREKIRRNKDRFSNKERELRDARDDLEKSQKLLAKMKELVEDKRLAERDELQRKLNKAESELATKDRNIKV